ncbi:TIGR00153 family protein [Thalassotalea profundi]|uniref:Phosphate transport regulator n=1 Tax=Thalassotalea profundi TaxID=2036687 RepID=A0ABQ3IH94_9GAMM|nr:TIGR00153 family protein [Thalassotalea profundi]GHE81292.1 phosphate transport regulator [Thalassotalea profundi]
MASNSILGVFAKSPIKPLEKHIRMVSKCSKQLVPFFDAVYAKNWTEAAKIRTHISKLERDADDLKRQLRMELPGGLFMPVDRTDILELLSQQDKIANKAKDIAGRIVGRNLEIPEALQEAFAKYVKRNIDAIAKAAEAINELDDLLQTGFRGREVELVDKIIHQLDEIENETDILQVDIRKDLLAIEANMNPVDVMFLYQIIDWVGDLADLAERVGARLEILLARK